MSGACTPESNNVPVSRPPCSGLTKPESLGGSKDLQFTNQSILLASESMAAMSKSDIELLAKNRGNAMQRYKEKKKTRRLTTSSHSLSPLRKYEIPGHFVLILS